MPQTTFVPVDPNQLVGPYPQQSVVPQPSTPPSQVGGGSKAGAIAKIFTEFVGGAAQGRIRKFSMEQNERLKNIAILGQYVQSVESDPTKTDEYKAMVRQKYFSALGMETLKSFDQKGGKGKKGKGGAGDQQQQGPAGMIAGVLKHVATGLVGGEMPKGAPDVNPHELIGQMEAEYHNPENKNKYSVQAASGQYASQINDILKKYPPGTPPETVWADSGLSTKLNEWGRVDAPGAQLALQGLEQAYPKAPSVAAEMQQIGQIGSRFNVAPTGTPQPGNATAQPQAIGFTGQTVTGEERRLLQKHGYVREGDIWEVQGHPEIPVLHGNIVDLPGGGPTFVDASGKQISVDVSQLTPSLGMEDVNILNPDNESDIRSVRYDKALGVYKDSDGRPLPSSMQNWSREGLGYRAPKPTKAFVNAQGQQVYRNVDRTFFTAPGTVRQTPDRWLQHFHITEQIRDARDARNTQVRAEAQYTTEKNRIKRTWAQKIASIDKDFQNLKPKEKEAKKKEYQGLQATELQDLEQDHNDMVESLGGMYGQGSPPPKPGGEDAPKKPPKSNVAPGVQAVLPD